MDKDLGVIRIIRDFKEDKFVIGIYVVKKFFNYYLLKIFLYKKYLIV